MSVRQRKWAGGKAWVVHVEFEHPDGSKTSIRKTSPVNTLRGAEEYERKLRQSLLDGTYGKQVEEVPRFAAFVERYLEHCQSATDNKRSTLKSKRDILRKHLVPRYGKLRLDQIDTEKIDGLKTDLAKLELSHKTINNVLTVLHNILSVAVEWKKLPALPSIRWFKKQPQAFDFLTFDEAEQLVRAVPTGRWKNMMQLALNTGLRIGELVGLAWEDVDLKGGRLIVRHSVFRGHLGTPKGGKTREVPLNQAATDALRAARRVGCPWVFPDREGQMIRNPQHACADAIARISVAAGLRQIGWHTLRHTFASHLAMRGVPMKQIQDLLGHATAAMTERYAHLSPESKRDAVRALEAK